jgi:hypothetical protein
MASLDFFIDIILPSSQPFPVKNYDIPKTTRECGIF